MSKNLGGRPVVHGLKTITGNRIRRARLAFASGKSRRKVASEIFKLSPRTFGRYLELKDPRAKALSRAVDEGERLKGEPLAALLCMLIDKRDQLCEKQSQMRYQLPPEGEPIDWSKIKISEENEDEYFELMKQIKDIENRIKQAVCDNDELKNYISSDGREGGDTLQKRTSHHSYLNLDNITSELGLEPLEVNDYESHRRGHKVQKDDKSEK